MPTSTNSTGGYRGGRRAASVESGGKAGHGGKFISRNQRYRDLRASLGLSTG